MQKELGREMCVVFLLWFAQAKEYPLKEKGTKQCNAFFNLSTDAFYGAVPEKFEAISGILPILSTFHLLH